MKTVLSADLGGTKSRFAVLAEDLSTCAVRRVSTPREREPFLQMVASELRILTAAELPAGWEAPTALGLGTAGVVASDGKHMVYAPNLPVDGFAMGDYLEEICGLPVTLINDGRASALGEFRYGHAAGQDPLLVLFFGTGIGIGLVVDGEPYEGASNAAGEVGHLLHLPGGRPCPCGREGCYEAYCAGRPLVERAAAEFGSAPSGAAQWTVTEIVALAAREPRAQAILEEAALAAGAMVASLCTLLNPAAVVLGGGVLQGWPELRSRIECFARDRCAAVITNDLLFVPSKGESDAILWGAALATGVFGHVPTQSSTDPSAGPLT